MGAGRGLLSPGGAAPPFPQGELAAGALPGGLPSAPRLSQPALCSPARRREAAGPARPHLPGLAGRAAADPCPSPLDPAAAPQQLAPGGTGGDGGC